ncbi:MULTISPECIES: hypothetical protein [unclassified Lysobacter]|uniref:hypothetical protein n=1 Tax=unclassified Lysobacter TaxID=2635362 RepID=UPI0006F96227|nr:MULTISPECIES: hypothetical protein [unclassified Lysobacter]KRA16270.1 hypothetical protein ASD69_16245 [Lysobacter sp. Root604]KRD31970.1 hypothetical protein ASE35_13490 [Lysobacter sp. Root916]KRD75839.1 hypothetical protein ASE43_13475 [Lysobacter sp. Root983]
MNMSHTPPPPDDREQREAQEWLAQERALRDERAGLPMDAGDARVAQYRLLVRALRAPAMEPLPADFAAQVARRVEASATLGDRLEQWLLNGLILVMAAVALYVVASYGGAWWDAIAAPLARMPSGLGAWLPVLGLCAGGTWLWDRMSDFGGRDRHARTA